ncbi:MAG TPA: hypothetical protein VNV35_14655 [Puia sp.]|jgi:hypothetical protein|nr:hypothetical protein [Puia sp.]
MITAEQIELPLFEVFDGLRKLDRQMGRKGVDISSYLLSIEMIRKGGVLMAREDLLFLCEKLWLKPYHENSTVYNRDLLRSELNRALEQFEKDATPSASSNVATTSPDRQEEDGSKGGTGGNEFTEDTESKDNSKGTGTGSGTVGWNSQISDKGKYGMYVADLPETARQTSSSISDTQMNDLLAARKYVTRGDYMPVNQRHIEQTVRSSRARINKRDTFVLDIGATIDKIARTGNFADYVLEKKDTFGTDWKILIDHEGSMVAFQVFAEEFAKALVNKRIGGQAIKRSESRIFYFKNWPVNFLYRDPDHKQSVALKSFIATRPMSILIISDAGAARGNYNFERIRQTYSFLQRLEGHKVAWLNPLPKKRWEGSSAETIATLTNMFEIGEMSASRLGNIVRLFKSKINPLIV